MAEVGADGEERGVTGYDYGVVAVVMVQVVTALAWVAFCVGRGERSGE